MEDNNNKDFNENLSEINKRQDDYEKALLFFMQFYEYGSELYIKYYEEYYGKKFELECGRLKLNRIGDKALSEEQIDYLSRQKGVDNSKSIGESIFFDDNERLQINISEMIEDISYDSQYTEFKGYHFTIYINDCVFFTPKFTKKEDALDYKKTFINKIHEDYSLIKFLIKDNYDLLCEYLEFLHIEGVNKDIYDYYKEETQKQYKILELTDTQHEARERRITIDELKQQINKLSEKNKKLKSKNRKLKKELKEINNLW